MKLSKKQILESLPRPWNQTEELFDQVLLVQGKTKHSSGYMTQVLIGAIYNEEKKDCTYQILGWPDDIEFQFGDDTRYGENGEFTSGNVRMDCYYPQGFFQFHSRKGKFHVSESLSSMTIKLIIK